MKINLLQCISHTLLPVLVLLSIPLGNSQVVSAQEAKQVLYREDFATKANILTRVARSGLQSSSKRRTLGWRQQYYESTRTWSISADLGPGARASTPAVVAPAIFTGHNGNYFLGRLNNSKASLQTTTAIPISGRTGLTLRLRLAAALAQNNKAATDYQNSFSHREHLYIYLRYTLNGRQRLQLLDAFRGGNPLNDPRFSATASPLQSRKSGTSISTVFNDYEWELDSIFAGEEVRDLQVYLRARTHLQYIGIDTIEVLADAHGVDACPLDPAKTEAGICGCGVPDDTPLCLFNGDFQAGNLSNWHIEPENAGNITVAGEGNYYAVLRSAGSSLAISTQLNTPAESFYLLFDTRFRTQSGSLRVELSGSEVVTVNGNEESGSNFTTKQVLVTAAELQGLTGATLEFTFDGESDSELFLDNVVIIPATAGELCVIGGDNIGDDNSTVNGNNAISAHGAEWVGEDANLGFSAIPFTSDGTATLYDFRIIATVIGSSSLDSNGNIDWSGHNWTFGIFRRADFIADGEPFLSYSFGATPDNWSGFRRINDLRKVPDTEPFGNFGTTGDRAGELYELRFNLENVYDHTRGAIFADPLPAGEYFLAVQSQSSDESYGEAGLGITRSAEHPNYWHDSVWQSPKPIVPNMTPDESVGVAFSVRTKQLACQ